MNGHMFALYCPDKLTCQLVILCDFSSLHSVTFFLPSPTYVPFNERMSTYLQMPKP